MFPFYRAALVGLLLITILAPGCATIAAGGSDKTQVTSNPSGARVYLNGQMIGNTPLIATMGRKDDAVFRFELEGYEPMTVNWDKVVNGWVFGNILIGGVIGLGIDLATSNQGKHSESPLYVQLKQTTRTPASVKAKK